MMRRIMSRAEEERMRKRNQAIVGIVLVAIMVLSSVGFAIQNNYAAGEELTENEATYNGFTFTNQNGLWVLGSFVFKNLPEYVEDVDATVNPIESYSGKPLYIYSEDSGAEAEIYVNLAQVAQRVQQACPSEVPGYEGVSCDEVLPVKTCADNFVIITASDSSGIVQEENCVFITGQQGNLERLVDQFLFKAMKIK